MCVFDLKKSSGVRRTVIQERCRNRAELLSAVLERTRRLLSCDLQYMYCVCIWNARMCKSACVKGSMHVSVNDCMSMYVVWDKKRWMEFMFRS